jgi:hypothetical protein
MCTHDTTNLHKSTRQYALLTPISKNVNVRKIKDEIHNKYKTYFLYLWFVSLTPAYRSAFCIRLYFHSHAELTGRAPPSLPLTPAHEVAAICRFMNSCTRSLYYHKQGTLRSYRDRGIKGLTISSTI